MSNDLEFNKIAASILLAGLIGVTAGRIADGLYGESEHGGEHAKRGYAIEVAEASSNTKEKKEPIKLGELLANASPEAGQKIAKKCMACHSLEKGGGNKVGPNLYGALGSHKAHRSDYAYSDAMKNKGGDWGYVEIFHFLHNPKGYVKGTKMAFAGLRKPKDIANVIAYLKQQGGKLGPAPADLTVEQP